MRYYMDNKIDLKGQPLTRVSQIMRCPPITIEPKATITEAMKKMHHHKIGCLPVVVDNELIGIITEMDFVRISARLLARLDTKEARTLTS